MSVHVDLGTGAGMSQGEPPLPERRSDRALASGAEAVRGQRGAASRQLSVSQRAHFRPSRTRRVLSPRLSSPSWADTGTQHAPVHSYPGSAPRVNTRACCERRPRRQSTTVLRAGSRSCLTRGPQSTNLPRRGAGQPMRQVLEALCARVAAACRAGQSRPWTPGPPGSTSRLTSSRATHPDHDQQESALGGAARQGSVQITHLHSTWPPAS